MTKKKTLTLALVLATGLGLTACQDMAEELNDAPIESKEDAPARVLAYPDGFGNVAVKCDGPNMVYSSRNGDGGRAIGIAPNDPRCRNAGEG